MGLRIRGIILGTLTLFCFFAGFSGFFAPEAQGGDFQVWTELKYSHRFKPSKFTLKWSMENRFRDQATEHFTFNTTLGFDYKFFKWLSAGSYYRYEKKKGKAGENRPFFEVVLKTPWKPVVVKNRQRFEIRIFPDDTWFRYRNLTQISHYFGERPVSYTPYIQDEVFIEQGVGFNENRLDVGNAFGVLNDQLAFAFYYRWQRKESGNMWENNHIFGTSVAIHY